MKVTKGLIKAYSRMGQKGAAAGVGMLEVAKMDPELRVLVADSIAIASLDRFYNLLSLSYQHNLTDTSSRERL